MPKKQKIPYAELIKADFFEKIKKIGFLIQIRFF